MSRQRRRDHSGAVQHVMVRSLPELPLLFRDDDDRRNFIGRLARIAHEERYRVLAFALMPNHVHIVGQTGEGPLWRVMKRLGAGYAASYNRKYQRRGYVLEDRYRSKLVSTRDYLETVVCYVLLNPLRGGVVRSLEQLRVYPWTSLPALLGSAVAPFTDVASTLDLFGDSPDQSRRALLRRLHEIVSAGPIEPLAFGGGLGDDRVTAPGEGAILEFAHEQLRIESDRIRRATRVRATWTIRAIVRLACLTTGADRSQLVAGARSSAASDARAIAAHLLVDELGCRASDVAALVGTGRSGMSKAIRRGRERAAELGVTLDTARKSSNVA